MHQFDPIFFTPPSGDTKRPRTLYKGKKGGDGGAAKRKEEEDKRVADAINNINGVFGIQPAPATAVVPITEVKTPVQIDENQFKRDDLYSTIGRDATNAASHDLLRDKSIAERDLNFILARQGLSGGSRDVDAHKDILDLYQQGVLKASNMGLAVANDARSADDKTRVNLINSIRSGLDQGSAMQQAYEGLRANSKQAQDAANAANLSGFFDVLKNQQQQAAYLQGLNEGVSQYQRIKSTPYSSAVSGDDGKTGSY